MLFLKDFVKQLYFKDNCKASLFGDLTNLVLSCLFGNLVVNLMEIAAKYFVLYYSGEDVESSLFLC